MRTLIKICKKHGKTRHVKRTDGGTRCVKCRSEYLMTTIKRTREILITEAGGKCSRCGYSTCTSALEFHHRDPRKKKFQLSGKSISLTKSRVEAKKCVLLCSNCHAEFHAGLYNLSE